MAILNRLFGSTPRTAPPLQSSKIQAACGAANLFVKQLHREPIDRGAVASFGNDYKVHQTLTSEMSQVASSLLSLEQAVVRGKGEGTRMYDSLVDLANQYRQYGSRQAIGVLLCITDGMDNGSVRYRNDPAAAGRAYRQALEAANVPVLGILIGVGNNQQIDRTALGTFARESGMKLITLDDFSTLGNVLFQLATQIQAGVQVDEIRGHGFAYRETRPVLQVQTIPYEYVLMIDRSGSMTDPA